jgi:hypothetical protein
MTTHRDTGNICGCPTIFVTKIRDTATDNVPRHTDMTESAANNCQSIRLKIVINVGPPISRTNFDRVLVFRETELGKPEARKARRRMS